MKEEMVAPLGQVLDDLAPSFTRIGFSKLDESEDSMAFGDGVRSVEISTNLRDPLEISISLIDRDGRKTAISPWQYLLDRPKKDERVTSANRFIEQHKLRNLTIAQMRVDPLVREYLQQAIVFALDFLSRYFDEVFNPSEELLRKYAETSRANLARLGIKL